jgi:hypothetical protein
VSKKKLEKMYNIGWKDGFAAARATPGWRTIESAPMDGTDILVAFDPSVGWQQIVTWREKKSGWRWTDAYTRKSIYNTPTHWQPLPPPPRVSHGEEDYSTSVVPPIARYPATLTIRPSPDHAPGEDDEFAARQRESGNRECTSADSRYPDVLGYEADGAKSLTPTPTLQAIGELVCPTCGAKR